MRHISRTLILYCAFVIVGLAGGSLGPAIPSFAEAAGETISRVGMLFIFYRAGYMAGSLGGGRVVDAWGGGRFTGGALVFIAAVLGILSYAQSLTLLFAAVFFLGLSLGASEVCCQTSIIRLHGAGVGPYMNGLHLSYCVGAVISPLAIGFMHSRSGVPTAFRLMAAAAACAGFLALRLHGAGTSLKKELVRVKVPACVVVFFAAVLLFSSAAESSFSGWVYSYALKNSGATEALAGILTSAFWLAMMTGRLAGVYLVGALGAFRLLFISGAGAVFSMTGLFVSGGSLAGLWIATILAGLFQASIIPLVFTLAGEKKIASGPVAGFFVASSSLGGMVFPSLLGSLMQSSGFGFFPVGIAAMQLMGFASFVAVYLTRGKLNT
jgi:fucose permease